jgi:ribosomal protein S18 acetylase RimI-like enzyme
MSLAVRPDVRAQGIARHLLTTALENATAHAALSASPQSEGTAAAALASPMATHATCVVELHVHVDNIAAQRLYTRVGFVCVEQVCDYYVHGVVQAGDALLMRYCAPV